MEAKDFAARVGMTLYWLAMPVVPALALLAMVLEGADMVSTQTALWMASPLLALFACVAAMAVVAGVWSALRAWGRAIAEVWS